MIAERRYTPAVFTAEHRVPVLNDLPSAAPPRRRRPVHVAVEGLGGVTPPVLNRETRRKLAHAAGTEDASAAMVRLLGRALGSRELGAADNTTPRQIQDAAVLAAATVEALRRTQKPLSAVLDASVAADTAALARRGDGDFASRLRGALTMTYTVGALESAAGENTPRARSWTRANAQFRAALPHGLRPRQKSSLAGLGDLAADVAILRAAWYGVPNAKVNVSGINTFPGAQDTEKDLWGVLPGKPAGTVIYARDGARNGAQLIKFLRTVKAYHAEFPTGFPPADMTAVWAYYAPMKFVSINSLRGAIHQAEPDRRANKPLNPANTGEHGNVFTALADSAGWIADELARGLLGAADTASNILCKVFTTVFGQTIGGFLCTLVKALLKFAAGTIAGGIEAVAEVVKALSDMIGLLIQGNVKEAAMSFLLHVNTAVVFSIGSSLAAMIGIPLTKSEAARNGQDPTTSVQGLGERLTKREPLFVVTLAISIVNLVVAGAVTGVSAGAAAATLRLAFGAVVSAMAGAIGIVAAGVLIQEDVFTGTPREVIEAGVEKLIRLLVPVVVGALRLADSAEIIWKRVQEHAERQGGWGAVAGKAVEELWAQFAAGLNDAWKQLAKLPPDFGRAVSSVTGFAKIIPVVVAALGFSEAEAGELVAQVVAVKAGVGKAVADTRGAGKAAFKPPAPPPRVPARAPSIDPEFL